MSTLEFVFLVQELTKQGLPSYIIAKILDLNLVLLDHKDVKLLEHYKNYGKYVQKNTEFIKGNILGCPKCFCGDRYLQYGSSICNKCDLRYCEDCMSDINVELLKEMSGICIHCNNIYKDLCLCGKVESSPKADNCFQTCDICETKRCKECMIENETHCKYC